MPYIDVADRRRLFEGEGTPRTPGELNYMFTLIATIYLKARGESYQTYNDIMGALEGAKLELYRRRVAPYEDKKMEVNGDVY
jgi:hypothetical protein